MSLHLSLIIDGDASGAKLSAQQARTAITDLLNTMGAGVTVYDKSEQGAKKAAQAHAGMSTQAMALSHSMRSAVEGIALGIPPTQILAQQFSHLSFAASAQGGLAGAFKELSAAVGGGAMLRNIALVGGGIGLIAAGTYSFYSHLHEDEQTAEQALELHAKLLGTVSRAYQDAQLSAGRFYDQSKAQTLLLSQQNLIDLQSNIRKQIGGALQGLGQSAQVDIMGNVTGFDQFTFNDKLASFKSAIEGLNANLGMGAQAVTKFRDEIAQIGASNPALQQQAAIILRQTQALGDMAIDAEKAAAMVRLLTGAASDLDRKMLGLSTRPSAFDQLIQRTKDQIEEFNFEAATAGQAGAALDALKKRHELVRAAIESGIPVQEALARARLEGADADTYAAAQMGAGIAKLREQIAFEGTQLFRSPDEQKIQERLRGQFRKDWESNSQAQQFAGQMRYNVALGQTRDLTLDVFRNIRDGVQQGKSLWDSLGNAGLNALSKIEDKALEMAVNGLFAAGTGGSGGGLFASLGALLFRAQGGGVPAGQWAVVGERGPELMRAESGGGVTVFSNAQSKSMLGLPGFASGGGFDASGRVLPPPIPPSPPPILPPPAGPASAAGGAQQQGMVVKVELNSQLLKATVLDLSGRAIAQAAPTIVGTAVAKALDSVPTLAAGTLHRMQIRKTQP